MSTNSTPSGGQESEESGEMVAPMYRTVLTSTSSTVSRKSSNHIEAWPIQIVGKCLPFSVQVSAPCPGFQLGLLNLKVFLE